LIEAKQAHWGSSVFAFSGGSWELFQIAQSWSSVASFGITRPNFYEFDGSPLQDSQSAYNPLYLFRWEFELAPGAEKNLTTVFGVGNALDPRPGWPLPSPSPHLFEGAAGPGAFTLDYRNWWFASFDGSLTSRGEYDSFSGGSATVWDHWGAPLLTAVVAVEDWNGNFTTIITSVTNEAAVEQSFSLTFYWSDLPAPFSWDPDRLVVSGFSSSGELKQVVKGWKGSPEVDEVSWFGPDPNGQQMELEGEYSSYCFGWKGVKVPAGKTISLRTVFGVGSEVQPPHALPVPATPTPAATPFEFSGVTGAGFGAFDLRRTWYGTTYYDEGWHGGFYYLDGGVINPLARFSGGYAHFDHVTGRVVVERVDTGYVRVKTTVRNVGNASVTLGLCFYADVEIGWNDNPTAMWGSEQNLITLRGGWDLNHLAKGWEKSGWDVDDVDFVTSSTSKSSANPPPLVKGS
jgi:hypothetical protein